MRMKASLLALLACMPDNGCAFSVYKRPIAAPRKKGSRVIPATPIHRRRRRVSLLRLSRGEKDAYSAAAGGAAAASGLSNSNDRSGLPTLLEPGAGPAVLMADERKDVYRSAIWRTSFWVASASAFGGFLWLMVGAKTGEEFFAGYLIEQSLSVDNLFVFLLLFEYFKVPTQNQDKVLAWGIFGAIVMRAGMIAVGAVALQRFRAILLLFASILVYSSAKVLLAADEDGDEGEDIGDNAIVRFSSNLMESTRQFDGDNFFTVIDGIKKATPLFICMIALEISDVVFAVDSIPAVFGVTEDPLVVFSSNIFAIMGLRSLYTILSKAATDLKYLEPAVAVVLGFIGCKMIAEFFGIEIPTETSLSVVVSTLTTGVVMSTLEKR